MKFIPSFFDNAQSGNFLGDNSANGRVTVEPMWQLHKTNPSYGSSVRGPYRWYQDVADTGIEYEIPNIKTIAINRTLGQDLATCTVTMYNMWHEGNTQEAELISQLGAPGYFWPLRGNGDTDRWNQSPGKGAFKKTGEWDAGFSWTNVLVPNALLYTYQGYGGKPAGGVYPSVMDNLNDNHLVITGVWLVDTVVGNSGGMMTISCKDVGRLLLDQIVFPPLIPGGIYPLEYYPAGKTPFDSPWGPKATTGVSPASKGEVFFKVYNGSGDGDSSRSAFPASNSSDGNDHTYALTEAYAEPDNSHTPWFHYELGQDIDSLQIVPWAGGYELYVHVYESGGWQGSNSIVTAGGDTVPYVKKINVPMAVPDGSELPLNIDLDRMYSAGFVRLSFRHLYYSGVAGSGGNQYRAGLRSVTFYRTGAKLLGYEPDFSALPWTYCMTAHPTRGYWVLDADGNVYGFGDAADYDSTAFGSVPLSSAHARNQGIAMASHPDGKGYWVLDIIGNVYAYGSADHHGDAPVASFPLGTSILGENDTVQAWDIAAAYDGEGYYVVYGDGTVKGFGSSRLTSGMTTEVPGVSATWTAPDTTVTLYMDAYDNPHYDVQRCGNAIAAHPHGHGFWMVNGSGEVFTKGPCINYGQLWQRTYDYGMGSMFRLNKGEFTHSVECTKTGKGYWITFGSGRIAGYGDARGKGPANIYENLLGNFEDNVVVDGLSFDPSFFRALIWSMARDPDGTGFWLLKADGSVLSYDAEFWGQPGYSGLTGYKWHEGNFNGDWAEIVKELLLWSGFTLYNPSIGSGTPEVYGAIEGTGIKTDSWVSAEKFDKKPIIDCIKELAEVVGYSAGVDEEGKFYFRSQNWWRAGNFDENGTSIYVIYDEDGSYTRAEPGDDGAEPFIPIIDEMVDMFEYNATLSGSDMRTEIIIGTDLPDPKDPSRTGYVRHVPPAAHEFLPSGVAALRGIEKPALWVSQLFQNPEEAQLMAELIGIHAWFAERMGSVNCVANPCIGLDDQIRLVERNTNETYIHRITAIDSQMDLDSGEWTYALTTHWLGDADNWVITREPQEDSPYPYVVISERLDRWQSDTGRGLDTGNAGNGSVGRLATVVGEFDAITTTLSEVDDWTFNGILTINTRVEDLIVNVDTLTGPLGTTNYFQIYEGGDLIYNQLLPGVGQELFLGDFGTLNTTKSYVFKIVGAPASVGNGQLKVTFESPDIDSVSIADNLIVMA